MFHYAITLWFPCLDGLIQTNDKVARVKKARENEPKASDFARFLNSSNFPKCLDQVIQTQKP